MAEQGNELSNAHLKISELEADLAERSRAFEDAAKVANNEISRRMRIEAERDEALGIIAAVQLVVDDECVPSDEGDFWVMADDLTRAIAGVRRYIPGGATS